MVMRESSYLMFKNYYLSGYMVEIRSFISGEIIFFPLQNALCTFYECVSHPMNNTPSCWNNTASQCPSFVSSDSDPSCTKRNNKTKSDVICFVFIFFTNFCVVLCCVFPSLSFLQLDLCFFNTSGCCSCSLTS